MDRTAGQDEYAAAQYYDRAMDCIIEAMKCIHSAHMNLHIAQKLRRCDDGRDYENDEAGEL